MPRIAIGVDVIVPERIAKNHALRGGRAATRSKARRACRRRGLYTINVYLIALGIWIPFAEGHDPKGMMTLRQPASVVHHLLVQGVWVPASA